MRCTGENNQLTVINAHVGYVLFTVVMTTFTVAPSSGVSYADALLAIRNREQVGRCYHSFTSCRPTYPPAYQISILTSINLGDIAVQKLTKWGLLIP